MTIRDSSDALDRSTLLIADDSGYTRTRLLAIFSSQFERVLEAEDGDAAVKEFIEHRPFIVIMDHVMRGRDGIRASEAILEIDGNARIVLLTSINERGFRDQAYEVGVARVVLKSDLDGLSNTVSELLGT